MPNPSGRLAALAAAVCAFCVQSIVFAHAAAPGAPGASPAWTWGAKSGIGTSYQPYSEVSQAPSRVWFSLSHGMVTETSYGLIHNIQMKDLRFVVKGDGFVDSKIGDYTSQVSYLDTDKQGRPLSLAYRMIDRARSGKYEIEQHIFTDPAGNVLFLRVTFRSPKGPITPYLVVDPAIGGKGSEQADTADNTLHAFGGGTHLVVISSQPFVSTSVGFADRSDGLTDLRQNGGPTRHYSSTGAAPGNVTMVAELTPVSNGEASYDFVVGFGGSFAAAEAADRASLARGYGEILDHYNGKNGQIGWETYLASLPALPELAKTATDGGKLLYVSAMVLKADEDKTHPGALIASLSTPWGDTWPAVTPGTGYRGVWPRDFYMSATALLALGDRETPLAALNFLHTVQVTKATPGNRGATGWFLQKTHVDGELEWTNVQLDETAMPIMLAWKLWRAGIVSDARIDQMYREEFRQAANFLVDGGTVDLPGNHAVITPPKTQMERWEEQPGYSPSTTAAEIAGLTAAAELASHAGDTAGALRFQAAADRYAHSVLATMFTTGGTLDDPSGHGRYFLRLSPDGDPNDHALLKPSNGHPALPEDQYLDAGFLELVRYGAMRADDPAIRSSIAKLDDEKLPENLRVKYEFHFAGQPGSFPGWRRYGNDGYGEDAITGANWLQSGKDTPGERGRVWPLLTGERGEYELAFDETRKGGVTDADVAKLRQTYVRAMELFAGQGLMLPEQVWDGVGTPGPHDFVAGQATDSAMPLVWTHAEYIKLLRSVHDRQVWDLYPPVQRRYAMLNTP